LVNSHAVLQHDTSHVNSNAVFSQPSLVGKISSSSEPGYFDSYVETIASEPDLSLDLVVVDVEGLASNV
jgi:hypothetical protein